MFCKYCGKEIDEGKEVCNECASKETKVEENVVIEEPKEETTNNETTTQTYVNTNTATSNTNKNTNSSAKSKVGAGIMGILLGAFGVHNFYLGYTGKAVAQLLITILSCGMLSPVSGIWGLVEGIMILTGDIKDANGNELKD